MSIVGGNKGCAQSKLVCVNSVGGIPGGTSTNFEFDLGVNLQLGCRVSISTVVFPNLIYNINASNNTYTYKFDGDPDTIHVIPVGQYSIGSLINALNADIGSSAVFWAYSATTNLVGINATNPHQIILNTTGTSLGTNVPLGLTTLLGGGALSTLNYLVNNPGNLFAVGTYAPMLGPPQMVYLRSTAIAPTNSIESGGRYSNTLLGIPVTAPFLGLNVFECKQDILCELQYARPRDLSKIDFQLTDDAGNIYDLHGGQLDIQLKVWFNN